MVDWEKIDAEHFNKEEYEQLLKEVDEQQLVVDSLITEIDERLLN